MQRPEKAESRRIRAEIRRVLLQSWDPIGIKDEPNAQDEYDGYIGDVYELLIRGASDEEISNHLLRIVEDRMGLTSNHTQQRETVKILRSIELRS